jgi:phosphoglycerate dehydrogenase-like enzyme
MPTKIPATLSAQIRPLLDGRLPDWLDVRWYTSKDEAFAMAPGAEIGWFDFIEKDVMAKVILQAVDLKWLNSVYAGVDGFPLPALIQRGTRVTNGAGINAVTIAEYVLMGMLNIAKGYREVVLAQARHEWLKESPGKVELLGSRALVVGFGAIGQLVTERLQAFGVAVTAVRRNVANGVNGANGATVGSPSDVAVLGPDQWQARLGEFDWVILAVPATAQTAQMIGAKELAAMKKTATLINVARGSVVDQDALTLALKNKTIGAAFLDVTEPEPLPAGHELWTLPNAHISMHLSGRAQTQMFVRSAERFLQNLQRYGAGEPLSHQVDLAAGY